MAHSQSNHKLYVISIDGVRLSVPLSKRECIDYGVIPVKPLNRRISEQNQEWPQYLEQLKATTLYFNGVRKRKGGLVKGLEALRAVTVGKKEAAQLSSLLQRLEAWVGPLNLQTPDFER